MLGLALLWVFWREEVVSFGGWASFLAKTSKWKSTLSAQERKTIAFMTEPFLANVRLSNAASVTSRCFGGTTMYDCFNWAGARNAFSFCCCLSSTTPRGVGVDCEIAASALIWTASFKLISPNF